ncbi:MAG TPA: glucose 1-dehydrogenase [Thermohalobaculum sp.]|nr:glucose 1-dehydrogenase [Thermohalobaculum sp.]
MSAPLEGQSALVTGASTGIGAAIAVELARRGARVAVNYLDQADKAGQVAAEAGNGAIAVQGDVTRKEDVDRVIAKTLEAFGTLDILVANAGIQIDAPLEALSAEDWRKVIDVNLTGQFLAAQAAVAVFRRQGVRDGVSRAAGKIVCMSSVHEVIPWPGRVNYAASKGGVKLMMETLALELAAERIRVIGIAPGAIRTDINRGEWEDEEGAEAMRANIPYGRIGDPADIARPVAWLVSDEADYITGTTIFVDGGMTLYPGVGMGG